MTLNRIIVCGAAACIAFATPAFGQQEAKKGAEDAKLLRDLAEANLAEVQAGKVALEKASSGEVKKFAQHMVDDHGKMLKELQTLAQSKQVKLPQSPAAKHQAALKKLHGASGEAFDKAYMQQMVKDHEQALKLAQGASKKARDAEIKAAAQKAAPEIEQHLQMARKIAGAK